jgi:undecaprenyl-diphosphatase
MLRYVILGIIQGITEFLPVSSSAHLVIMQKVLGVTGNEVAVSVILHLGTACALVIFFLKDLLGLLRSIRLIALLFTTTIITLIIGLLGKDFFESLFSSIVPSSIALIVTGAMLITTKNFMRGSRKEVNFKDAAVLGLTQSIAIIPGISRSGTTISTLLFRKLDIKTSFRFSFLAAIPVIFGAALLESKKIDLATKTEFKSLLLGFLSSFLVGISSLWVLKTVLNKAKFYYFGYYCIFIAIITLLFLR